MALDFPVIYLLPTFIDTDRFLELQGTIPTLTHDVNEADVVVANLSQSGRARFELRRLGLNTDPLVPAALSSDPGIIELDAPQRARRGSMSSDSSDTASEVDADELTTSPASVRRIITDRGEPVVRIVKLAWLTTSLERHVVLPVDEYLLYQGIRKEASEKTQRTEPNKPNLPNPSDIVARAQLDTPGQAPKSAFPHGYKRQHERTSPSSQSKRPRLLLETTSEHDIGTQLPPIPDYLHTTYSCQRPSPADPPNDAFIEHLKTIRTFRTLKNDKIGVRAYSTAIATLCAYPYPVTAVAEIERLPGCSAKIAAKWKEWKENGFLQENVDAENDDKLSVLKLFYNIWGVGETTAREFYNKGWRDLDDVIEYGWETITRVQQIGIKYYEEFLVRIPRQETAAIGDTILEHANRIHAGFQMVIVGSYRRGRQDSGDVDVVLSNPDENATAHFVEKVVVSLENAKFITHTLTLSTRNSERGQCPLPWKGEDRKPGTGFDTLDKALVVWQDPEFDHSKHSKNPNPHRRVDIIISPWKTAGCAVIGWSGGTTFERDLRRYCKKEKRLKFDSSGIRNRRDGGWVDLESDLDGQAPDLLTAEKRVFAGLGLEWRPPEERVTG
ncbi:DNA polymerase-like protein [Microdochium trichocladiopsis]|uniref:DNA polymerase n=1 Tax=Microdochium trichocladiopsis TaxID=1682393 RepID=A0A9P8Y968_9PEZI|nr:DNA polymerase-like protein [Microdochium trichocladiopsis]KAH7032866.1 DNA polymerase-like protein [Microdochium trichocladiopsis]